MKFALPDPARDHIAVIGLGYVGLPLAVAFGRTYRTTGFDLSTRRIAELTAGRDSTREVGADELAGAERLELTGEIETLRPCNVYLVTAPTPIDGDKQPNLAPLHAACRTVARVLSPGDLVIFESTVYPGATEETCVPVLEQGSGLRFNVDFFVGYSPERINPGDREHRLGDIVKVTSGSTPEAARFVDALYRQIVSAGTHLASSIRVAEAAKVIENTQRDLNIALINELAIIFNRLDIDTQEVLTAAGTKWNFLPFQPGLVGGHCISVDPYYLTHKALQVGYHPEVILAGRRLNDGMGTYVAGRVVKLMTQHRIHVVGARMLLMGLAFKENCPDLRNSRVIDIVRELESYSARVDVYDPWVDPEQAQEEFGLSPVAEPAAGGYDAIILAVAHDEFRELGPAGIRRFGRDPHVLFDVKALLPIHAADGRL